MSGLTSTAGTENKQKAFEIQGADGAVIRIEPGDFYFNVKARCRRMMLNSLSNEGRRVYACLELATMGFQKELAVVMEWGKERPLTPTDISRQTGLSKQNVRRAVEELETLGLAKREADDGGILRNGHILIYSWAVPRQPLTPKGSQRATTFPNWFPEAWEPLKAPIKRLKLSFSIDEESARDYFAEGERIARDYQKAEKVVKDFLERVCARPEKRPINKEERTERTSERTSFSSSSLSTPSVEPPASRRTTTTPTEEPEYGNTLIDEAMVDTFGIGLDATALRRLWQNCRAKKRNCTAGEIAAAINDVFAKVKHSRIDSPVAYVWEAVPNELEASSRRDGLLRRRAAAAGAAEERFPEQSPEEELREIEHVLSGLGPNHVQRREYEERAEALREISDAKSKGTAS